MKKILGLLLVFTLLLGNVLNASAASAPTPKTAYETMIQMKDKYPEGMTWTNDNFYAWNGGIYSGGYGCAGFAFLLSDAAFGKLPARVIYDITIKDVHEGDILRINRNSHSVIILEVYSEYVVIAEGNYNSSIHWGRTLSAEQVAAADYMMTRYPKGTVFPPAKKPSVMPEFDDVYEDWYTPYVRYVYENSLMTGIKGTKHFAPDRNISKEQVAQVLYNMDGQPEVTMKTVFTDLCDVYEAEWYADAVAWAYAEGIVTGDINTKKFTPNTDVTREQLALMMYRYANYAGYPTDVSGTLDGLKNAENTANWALDGVKWAVGAGLISGIEKNGVRDLAPQGNATRAQVAAILQRFCEADR